MLNASILCLVLVTKGGSGLCIVCPRCNVGKKGKREEIEEGKGGGIERGEGLRERERRKRGREREREREREEEEMKGGGGGGGGE